MKNLFLVLSLLMSITTFAHEGGHGEVDEGGKFGGIMSPIVHKKQAGQGKKATVLYKAELVRSESGKLSFYIFDNEMKLVDLKAFGPEIQAKLEVKKKGKFQYVGDFKLTKNGNHFTGQLPKIEYKPFNIDFFLTVRDQELFVGFSNLD
jgi:hypothetical protein